MSPYAKVAWLPEWLRTWIRYYLLPALGFESRELLLGALRGVSDMLLLTLLGMGLWAGGRYYMEGQYTLSREVQTTALKWAPVSDYIARKTDIPREVPLVLWFKENSMQAVNPDNCIGIMGAYDLVRSGQRPCFTPGPVSEVEIVEQLTIGAVEFKERCPEVTYFTQDPATLKRCYFAYNAGAAAAGRLDPEQSAYVMNNYDEAHTNMVYSDVELGTVRVTAPGAWPSHLAIQSLILARWDRPQQPLSIALVDLSTRIYDWGQALVLRQDEVTFSAAVTMAFPEERPFTPTDCMGEPHERGRLSLRPTINPVTERPLLTQDVHGCSYGMPGIDISSHNTSAVLQAPMPGQVTTYTDRWYNSTIRIENGEWIVWLLHPRSYFVKEGEVKLGQAVGVMGAIGIATGPHVHYTVFDKVNETFVDPRHFLP